MKSVSFVIPVPPGIVPHKAISKISALNYPSNLLEIILVEGNRPSKQRNLAVSNAAGEVIYFLDDDSYILPESLSEGLKYLEKFGVGAVGGPALTHSEAGFLERVFGDVVGSYFGTGITRSRNKAIGEAREVRGEELILCNLMIPKAVFEGMSGLNVDLYPNEENELLKRMRNSGYKFYYVPSMIVHRTKRDSVSAFVRQMYSYGHGRGRHILKRISAKDMTFFAPSLLCFYLLLLPFVHERLYLLPLLLYLTFIGTGSLLLARRRKDPLVAAAAFPLLFLMHICYGVGLVTGVAHYLKRKIQFRDRMSVEPARGITDPVY